MIFMLIVLKFPILFYKIEVIITTKVKRFRQKWKRLLNKENPMGKDHWNRKSIYSIRKFTVGTCSVLIGTCSVLFGASVASATPVSADETPIAVATENVEKEAPKEETRKLAAGCSKHCFEVVDRTDEVSNIYTARRL